MIEKKIHRKRVQFFEKMLGTGVNYNSSNDKKVIKRVVLQMYI